MFPTLNHCMKAKKKSIQQKINPHSFLELYLNVNIYGIFNTMAENKVEPS